MEGAKPLKYLFVCYANEHRSRTAEEVCKRMAKERNLAIETSSAGVSPGANNPLTKELVNQADIIFVMEKYMQEEIEEEYGESAKKIVCFNIPDIYQRHNPELVRILETELEEYL